MGGPGITRRGEDLESVSFLLVFSFGDRFVRRERLEVVGDDQAHGLSAGKDR